MFITKKKTREEFIKKTEQVYEVMIYNDRKDDCGHISEYTEKDSVVNDIGKVKKLLIFSVLFLISV